MCGLAGVYRYGKGSAEPMDPSVGMRMVEAVSHRGPDDGGLLVTDRLLLGHRRLSILDLSDEGHQPMADENERCWVAYNGEVYNFPELRGELERAGHRFRSATDTEVLLRGYLQWGRSVLERLDGMFAFALWDRREESLWLVRDHAGIKPLFFRDDGSRLWFGSEIKAILADPDVPRRPDLAGLDAFLTFGYVPAPATGFEGIGQLMPGEWLLARQGRVVRQKWFELPYPQRPTDWSRQECSERLEAALDSAVRRQMISDVPLGALLSGGIDSSAIVRSMSHSDSHSVDTFTIGFEDDTFDESPVAAQVAARYGTEHHERDVQPDAASLLKVLVSHAEQPLADNSMLPFFLLAEFTRSRVSVALSGDGADELLAGYDTYRASQLAPYYRMLPSGVRRSVIRPLVHRLPVSQKKYGLTNVLRRFVDAADQPPLRDHCSWRRIVSADLREQLYSPQWLRELDADPIGQYAASGQDGPDWLSPLQRQLQADLRFHLPGDMLVKVDRMSMAHSLEVRVPFLAPEVIRTCLAMPPRTLRHGKKGKLPLRELLRRDLPTDVVDRKKAGFVVPLERWLRHQWQPLMRQVWTPELASQIGGLRWPVLETMLADQAAGRADHAYPLFALLILGLWWKIWITGELPSEQRRPSVAPTRVRHLNAQP